MAKTICFLIFFLPIVGFSQIKTIGTPNISNYPKSVYNASTQNWGIAQDKNGFMYFANNDGILCFDGVRWNLNKVSDNSPVRTVFADSKNKLYIGLINDFGIFTQNEPKAPSFTSLRHLLPSEISVFDDVWRIHETPEGIVFQTYNYLFIYKDSKIEVLKPQKQFHFSFKVNNQLIFHERGNGIFILIGGKLVELPYEGDFKNFDISAMLESQNNEMLVCTPDRGVFITKNGKLTKWNTPANELLRQNKIYCASSVSGGYYAFGTILNGLIITDLNGNIIQILNNSSGIQNNTILSLYVDDHKNLWLGLDNGIDYVELNSPLSFIGNSKELGTGYCCRVFDGNLYLGTNQGLFIRPFNEAHNNQPFELVKNTAGQVWSLEVFDGQLICCHNQGTFIIEKRTATKISNIEGAWKYIRLKNNPSYLLGGHYEGLVVLKKGKSGWEFYKKLKKFNESSRYIKQSNDGEIWISHGEKGIFRLTLNGVDSIKQSELYSAKNGLPTTTGNILIEFKDKIYISTNNKIYKYENLSDSCKISPDVNTLFDVKGQIKELETDDLGNVWYIADNETGVLRFNEDLTYTKITSPFIKLSNENVNEFEFIYPLNSENVFFGIENGFAHYTSKFPKSYSQSFQAFITKIEIPYMDTVLYFYESESSSDLELPFRKNTFRFHYTAPFFENNEPLYFSYFLEDFSESWSEWSTDSYKDFSNLEEGSYLFKVKAKNIYDVESEISTFGFVISPPWHRAKWAYFLYAFFILVFTYLLVKFILYRIQLANKREKLRHQIELQKKEAQFKQQALVDEKEIIKLRNDKLRAEKLYRDKELANQTMNLVQKNEFLIKLDHELLRIQNSTQDGSVISKLALVKKRISKEIDNENQNKLFETYFEEVHAEFFKRLKEKYPRLSPNDLRLCAYIRMNIPSKEIATLLHITFRSVEISRHRLRKKLELSRDTSLSTFLSNI